MDTTDTWEPQDPLLVQLHDARLDQQSREWTQAAHAEVVELIRRLYVDLGQGAGGPLHVILDDSNAQDHWLREDPDRYGYLFNGDFERWAQAGDDVSLERRTAIRDTCEQILALLRPMAEQQRRDAINEFWEWWRPNATRVMAQQAGESEDDPEEDGPEPYVWTLPQGVAREQAQEVYEKAVAWGLWELDPGGFRIRTYEEAIGHCEPIPCPPFNEVTLQTSRYVWAGPDEPAPIDQKLVIPEKLDSEWLDSWRNAVDAATAAGFRRVDFLPAPGPAQMPRIITLPEGVNPEEADRWVQGCIQLGIIEAGTGGVLYLPHGQQL